MYKPTLAVLAVMGVVFAQESVVHLFLLGFTSQSIVGSIIKSDATATTYTLNCGDPANCGGQLGGIPETGLTYTEGSSTLTYNYVETDIPLLHILESDVLTSFTDGGTALGAGQDVTLTAGPLPTNSAAPSTTSDSSNGKITKTSPSSGATGATGIGTGGSSSSSKAAAPMITQAPWLIGGAAVAAAYAAM
ncbi:hypothetical protein N431DRAFT_564157 [Stipitochalara longipes BDJ]|nr:hypothetical protein N431DRAFT_564157 [Stipitochalara longipes BDJ]